MSIVSHHDLEYFAHRYGVFVVVAIVLAALLAPLFIRLAIESPITPGADSYAQLLDAQVFIAGKSLPTTYGLLLGAMVVFGVPWLLPLLLAGTFLLLLGFFLAQHLKSRSIIVIALSAIAVSPAMSLIGTSHSPILLAGILFICALLCAKKHYSIVIMFMMLTTLTIPVFGVALLFALMLLEDNWRKWAAYSVALLVSIALCVFISHPLLGELFFGSVKPNIFFELGAIGGISVFYVLLASYGYIMGIYGSKAKMGLAVIILLLCAIIFPSTSIMLTCILSLLVGYAMMQLLMAEWRLEMLQETLIIIIGCIAIFLLITSGRERVQEMPDGELAHALISLHNTQREGGVLTAPEYAPLVMYYSGRNAILTLSSSPDILVSRDAKRSYSEFDKDQLAYVMITDSMQGTILQRSDSGILFLLQNSERFYKISETKSVRIWYYIPSPLPTIQKTQNAASHR